MKTIIKSLKIKKVHVTLRRPPFLMAPNSYIFRCLWFERVRMSFISTDIWKCFNVIWLQLLKKNIASLKTPKEIFLFWMAPNVKLIHSLDVCGLKECVWILYRHLKMFQCYIFRNILRKLLLVWRRPKKWVDIVYFY